MVINDLCPVCPRKNFREYSPEPWIKRAIEMTNNCERYHSLPRPGNYLGQRHSEIMHMNIVQNEKERQNQIMAGFENRKLEA